MHSEVNLSITNSCRLFAKKRYMKINWFWPSFCLWIGFTTIHNLSSFYGCLSCCSSNIMNQKSFGLTKVVHKSAFTLFSFCKLSKWLVFSFVYFTLDTFHMFSGIMYTQSFSEMELLFQERQSHELFDTVVVVVVVELFIINKWTGLIFD